MLFSLFSHSSLPFSPAPLSLSARLFPVTVPNRVPKRMRAWRRYVFDKKNDTKNLFVSEIKSILENSSRPASTLLVKMLRKSVKGREEFGQVG